MLLSYATSGSPTDEALVFLHGLGAQKKQITSVLDQLTGYSLIAPDLPGHGESRGFDPASYSFDFFADQVIALMDHLGIKQCHLGGLSMGSAISLNIALRYPKRFKSLVLNRPAWLDSGKPPHLELVAKSGELEQSALEELPGFQSLLASNPLVAKSITGVYGRCDPAVLTKMWESQPFSTLESLSTITEPALVMSSPQDDLHPQGVASKIASSLSNSQLIDLPARYYEPEAYKKVLNQHLSKFLK
jgi:pimeloyl-ACP methyl ester carboxylesterase